MIDETGSRVYKTGNQIQKKYVTETDERGHYEDKDY